MSPSTQKIRKAVFPVAGMGTRFLPATKAMPKEMLPIVDKPLIQYAVEEAVAAGITDLVFVTGRNKRAIEDHFDAAPELEADLSAKNKHALLDVVRHILPAHVRCIYLRQAAALGLGHAVLCAQPVIGNEAFAVLLADDLIEANVPVTRQLVEQYETHGASVLAVQDVPRIDTDKYGIVTGEALGGDPHHTTLRVSGIIEKPAPEHAPSTLAVVGRYILSPQIFAALSATQCGQGGEIQLTDGIARLLQQEPVLAHRYTGTRYDCGSKRGFWHATMMLGLKDPDIADLAKTYGLYPS